MVAIEEPSHRASKSRTNAVKLSYWVFTVWWLLILAVHLVTCVYNALYAYSYWKLEGTYLNLCLEFYKIGLPQPYHNAIATTHAAMSAIHGSCILLMLSGSVWQRSLAFTPWSSCKAGGRSTTDAREGSTLDRLGVMYNKVTYPCGLFGVRGKHFEVALIVREVVETALQTVQAYRMSALLPRALLNRFYVVLLVINCWSSPLVDIAFHQQEEARRRFACIALDSLLDVMSCMGIQLIVLLAYAEDYDPGIKGFDGTIWYHDEWVARALNEFQIIVVVSWSDLVSRAVFSFSLFITTNSMKKLMLQQPRRTTRISTTHVAAVPAVIDLDNSLALVPLATQQQQHQSTTPRAMRGSRIRRLWLRRGTGSSLLLAAQIGFGVWGVVILGLHIHASLRPTLPQCLMQVRPWTVRLPSCYLAGLDCRSLEISGSRHVVEEKWREFEASTVVQLLIRHCPALEVPHIFSDFHNLRGVKVYNTTILDWSDAAAITNTNHPEMTWLFIVRVNMTDGLLPAGFQSKDFPRRLNDIEICATNLRVLPSDLDTKWTEGAVIQVEYSQLGAIPLAIARLKPYYLFLTGNRLDDLPPEIFGVDGMVCLGIGDMEIAQLPRNVTRISPSLSLIEIDRTDVSFFWSWVDEFVGRVDNPGIFVAGESPYCAELEQIEENITDSFQVSLSPEYSSILMDPSETNRGAILRAVDCANYGKGPYYPLEFDDSNNAISTPPPLVKHW